MESHTFLYIFANLSSDSSHVNWFYQNEKNNQESIPVSKNVLKEDKKTSWYSNLFLFRMCFNLFQVNPQKGDLGEVKEKTLGK